MDAPPLVQLAPAAPLPLTPSPPHTYSLRFTYSSTAETMDLLKILRSRIDGLVPPNLDGFMFSGGWKSGKASQIKLRLAADFTGWETDNQKFGEQFERLVRACRRRRP